MQQFQIEYTKSDQLKKELTKIKLWCRARVISTVMFQIYSEFVDKVQISEICTIIENDFPNAVYAGCSSNGNIENGKFSQSNTIITCTIFEYLTTKVQVFQYSLSEDNANTVVENLIQKIKNFDTDVKAVQFLTTIRGMSMTPFCNALSKLPDDVQIYGGGAFNTNLNDNSACVFSSDGNISDNAVAFVIYSGNDFFASASFITGWKSLGKSFAVTKSKGAILYELDNKPAFEVYHKYLGIDNDKNFFENTLEFPFLYQWNGINILRAPIASNDDGSLIMTSSIDENLHAKIAYGDPNTILNSIRQYSLEVKKFCPEIIQVFSCAARRTFWGETEVSKETLPFQLIAPTSGFYTSGEFLRTGQFVNQHNVTLVVAALREGRPIEKESVTYESLNDKVMVNVSMVSRLAHFIDTSVKEITEAQERLAKMAITDSFTGLYNRLEIQKQITNCFENSQKLALIMLDIDDFKKINDTFGHKEGDCVLQKLCAVIKSALKSFAGKASAGRWGGEEFMLLLSNADLQNAKSLGDTIRQNFEKCCFESAKRCTISVGVTIVTADDTPDKLCVRVDKALYKAKSKGKNTMVIL